VVFTAAPQDLVDDVHKTAPLYLGYHDNESQAERIATVSRPIQSWYTTESLDFNGSTLVDAATSGGIKLNSTIPGTKTQYQLELPHATVAQMSGSG
jgi:hypothetical protein